MRRADGRRWLISQGAPRTSSSGDFLGMIVTSQDVTDQPCGHHSAAIARAKDEFIAVSPTNCAARGSIRTSVGILRAHAAQLLSSAWR
jgi:hypothetical protein